MTTSWGAFKGLHNGEGIYWSGTYNVEGIGQFRTMAEVKQYIDETQAKRGIKEKIEQETKINSGQAIRVIRNGDTVKVYFPDGEQEMTIRQYRQQVFDLEEKYGKEFIIQN